jgi:hypothetical protein
MTRSKFREILDSQLRNLIKRIEDKHNGQIERLKQKCNNQVRKLKDNHNFALDYKERKTTDNLVGRRSELQKTIYNLKNKKYSQEEKIELLKKQIEELENKNHSQEKEIKLLRDGEHQAFPEETDEENYLHNSQSSSESEEEFTKEFNSYFNNQQYSKMLENISLKRKIVNNLRKENNFNEDEYIKKDDVCKSLYRYYNEHVKGKISRNIFIWSFFSDILDLKSENIDMEEFHDKLKNHKEIEDVTLTITDNPLSWLDNYP